MSKLPLIINSFVGGLSTDKKTGIAHSFAYSRSVDFRAKPSQFTLLPKPRQEDDGVVEDLILNAVMDNNGNIFSIGQDGYFYKRDTSGNWTLIGNVPSSTFGLVYRPDQDAIFITGETTVSSYTPLSSTPVLQPNFYNISLSTYNDSDFAGFNVSSYQDTGNTSTAIGTAVVEGDTTSRFFQTDIMPLNSIAVRVKDRGTGDWTLTLHDGLNTVLGTATVTNANLVNGEFNKFVFSAPVNVQVAPAAQTYHIHVTSTVADGSVWSTNINDLSSCDLQVWADRLIDTRNGMHPATTFQQYMCIGNGQYLSVVELLGSPEPTNDEWQRHKLTFPPGYEVCGLAVFNEYLAIACEKAGQEGCIFFWDGLASTYNYFTLVPEGSPYAIHQYKNVLYYYAGGAWYAIGSVGSQPQKIRAMPGGENSYSVSNNNTKIYPYAATVRNGVQLMAYPSVTTNETIEYGVYSWGQVDQTMPLSFGYSYVLSTGSLNYSVSNGLAIGMVQNFGDTLLISWKDTGLCGVDVVDSNSPPASYGVVESLISDAGYVAKYKQAHYIEATYLPPPDGVEFKLKYSIDRGDWQYSEPFTADTLYFDQEGYARLPIGNAGFEIDQQARYHEFQLGIEVTCDETVTESPVVTSLSLVYDNLIDEVLQ